MFDHVEGEIKHLNTAFNLAVFEKCKQIMEMNYFEWHKCITHDVKLTRGKFRLNIRK